MKKVALLLLTSLYLYASQWCPITALSIAKHIDTSYQAKLKSNDSTRVYANLYALLKDRDDYGVYDIKKYDSRSKSYQHVEIKDALHVKNNPLTQPYKKRYYPMGKKVYEKRCSKKIELDDYFEISDLKDDLQKKCHIDSELHLHATTVYLWDVKRVGGVIFNEKKIHVEHDEKCPICGMYVYKYPRWAAQIYYKERRYSFDGVKDMMKWYFKNRQNIVEIKVSDYYSQQAIDGKKAFYVKGSDTYGPMGHELIPFAQKEDAMNFLNDHHGEVILKFEDIRAKFLEL